MTPLTRRAAALSLALLVAAALLAPLATAAGDGASAASTYRYTFAWRTQTFTLDPHDGFAVEGEGTDIPFGISRFNVTQVVLVLTWRDTVGEPDNFTLTTYSAAGGGFGPVSGSGSEGRLELPATLGSAPAGEVVIDAGTDADAWRAFNDAHPPAPFHRGDWSARIALTEAGDAYVAGVHTEDDTGNNFTLAVSGTAYVGVLVKKEKGPEDPSKTCPDAPGCTPTPDPEEEEDPDTTAPGNGAPRSPGGTNQKVGDGGTLTRTQMVAGAGAALLGMGIAILVARRKP